MQEESSVRISRVKVKGSISVDFSQALGSYGEFKEDW